MAGPNGSGKSTIYTALSAQEPAGSIWIINPDELSKRISDQEGLPLVPDANLEAVKRIETWLYASVRAHQTVGVETVLSTDKYQKLVSFAHERGFGVRLVYVYLKTPDINVDRVAARVSKGGHDVPEDKIRSRWTRSFKQLAWFLANADRTDIFDNSEAEPRLVLSRQGPELEVYGKLIPEIEAALRQAFPALVRIADQEK